MRRFLLSLGMFVFLCAPALAGQLFPPENSAACVAGRLFQKAVGINPPLEVEGG